MDRELVLAILVALLCGGALTAAGWWPTGSPVASSGRALERRAWRRMWLPFGPAVLLFAALCGWALVEPADAEPVPNCLLWGAVALCGGCGARDVAGVMVRREFSPGPDSRHRWIASAATSLLSPRIANGTRRRQRLLRRSSMSGLHARHRDPLRLWLAQLGSDLLWPWPAADARFRCWRRALELARDEEARLNGIAGPDLAAAILAALRLSRGDAVAHVPRRSAAMSPS